MSQWYTAATTGAGYTSSAAAARGCVALLPWALKPRGSTERALTAARTCSEQRQATQPGQSVGRARVGGLRSQRGRTRLRLRGRCADCLTPGREAMMLALAETTNSPARSTQKRGRAPAIGSGGGAAQALTKKPRLEIAIDLNKLPPSVPSCSPQEPVLFIPPGPEPTASGEAPLLELAGGAPTCTGCRSNDTPETMIRCTCCGDFIHIDCIDPCRQYSTATPWFCDKMLCRRKASGASRRLTVAAQQPVHESLCSPIADQEPDSPIYGCTQRESQQRTPVPFAEMPTRRYAADTTTVSDIAAAAAKSQLQNGLLRRDRLHENRFFVTQQQSHLAHECLKCVPGSGKAIGHLGAHCLKCPVQMHVPDAGTAAETVAWSGFLFKHDELSGNWFQRCEYEGKLDKQLADAVAHPQELLQKHVAIAEITDRDHPAFQVGKTNYLAYAREQVEKGTVLGLYGGIVRSDSNQQDRAEADGEERASCCFDLQNDFFIDADTHANELAFANDYRLKARQSPHSTLGKMRINARPILVWHSPTEDRPELFPRLAYVSTKTIPKHAEIFIDYGEQFWVAENENAKKKSAADAVAAATATDLDGNGCEETESESESEAEAEADEEEDNAVDELGVLCEVPEEAASIDLSVPWATDYSEYDEEGSSEGCSSSRCLVCGAKGGSLRLLHCESCDGGCHIACLSAEQAELHLPTGLRKPASESEQEPPFYCSECSDQTNELSPSLVSPRPPSVLLSDASPSLLKLLEVQRSGMLQLSELQSEDDQQHPIELSAKHRFAQMLVRMRDSHDAEYRSTHKVRKGTTPGYHRGLQQGRGRGRGGHGRSPSTKMQLQETVYLL